MEVRNSNLSFLKRISNFTEKDLENVKLVKRSLKDEELIEIARKFVEHLKTYRNLRGEEEKVKEVVYEYLKGLIDLKEDQSRRENIASFTSKFGVTPEEIIAEHGKLFELLREKLKPKFDPERLNELCLSLVKVTLMDVSLLMYAIRRKGFETLRIYLDNLPDIVAVLDANFNITFINKTAEEKLKLKKREVIGEPFYKLFPERYKGVYRLLCEQCKKTQSGTIPEVIYLGNPKLAIIKPFEVSYQILKFDGETFYIIDLRDVSEEIRKERERQRISRLYSLFTHLMKIVLEEAKKEEVLKKVVDFLVDQEDFTYAEISLNGRTIVRKGKLGTYSVSFKLKTKDEYYLTLSKEEEFYPAEIQVIINFLEELSGAIDALSAHEKLEKVEFFDKLTRLPTRVFFVRALSDRIEVATKERKKVVVIALDIDSFTAINTLYGTEAGDKVLVEVADRLRDSIRIDDVLARIGADTFGVILTCGDVPLAVNSFLARLSKLFSKPVVVNGKEIQVTFSIGISVFPDDGEEAEKLLGHAIYAMFEAKKFGGNRTVYYSSKEFPKIEDIITKRNELLKAIDEDEFILYYQPKIDLKQKKVVGCEALLRWKKGDELVPPYEFIPILEETGLINEVGIIVLEKACRQLNEWHKKGIEVEVAVNISPVQFRSGKFLQNFFRYLENCAELLYYMGVEVTETALVENVSVASLFLKSLSELGVRVYIDDFGTGYSSILHLKQLPVLALKIDVEFVKDMDINRRDYEIVRGVINLAHSLGLKTVAEGVEKEIHEKMLIELGCDYAQGYYYSPPLPPEEFEDFYKKFNGLK
ncbi:MAG: hypothetical protein DSY32_04225 [Aquifex sp.]|nr:MAG: hypothetical protein DSY32_04225 [Aquifex sp.]